jgi:hypothetical protein
MFKECKLLLLLCCTILAVFVVPRNDWNFLGDDFGAMYAGRRGATSGLRQFWSSYSNGETILPSNASKKPTFLSVVFRPLTLSFYALQYALFGVASAWPYFLVAIFLHACAAALLFLLLRGWFTPLLAFLLAVCFAVYPLMGRFVGRVSTESYSLCLIILLLCVFLQHKFLVAGRWWVACCASGLFFVGLLLNEILLPMPGLFLLPALLGNLSDEQRSRQVKFFLAMLFAVLICVFTRLYCYQLLLADNALLDFHTTLTQRFYYSLTLVTDTFAMTGLAEGNSLVKSFGLLLFGTLLTVGFLRFKEKKLLLGLFLAFCIACWPAIIFYHAHRYLYFSIPIFLVALVICLQQLLCERGVAALLLGLILLGIFECNRSLWAFEQQARQSTTIAKTVAKFMDAQQVAICFALMPMEIMPSWGAAQAVWLYATTELPVFYDGCLNAQSNFNNHPYCKIPEQNLFNLAFDGKTIKIDCLDSAKVWLGARISKSQTKNRCSLGQIKKFACRADTRMLTAIELELSLQLLQQPLALACWDSERSKVVFCPNNDQ